MKWLILGLVGIASISLLRMVLSSSKKDNKFGSKGKYKGRGGKYGKKGGWKSKKDQLKRFINRHRNKEISDEEEEVVKNEVVDQSSTPQPEVKEEKPKPVFHGPKLYSYFKCILCDRCWKNGNSSSGEGQTCASCQINVLPWRQDEIKPWKKKKRAADKEHSIQTCPKCQDLGRPCGQGQDPNILLNGLVSLK